MIRKSELFCSPWLRLLHVCKHPGHMQSGHRIRKIFRAVYRGISHPL